MMASPDRNCVGHRFFAKFLFALPIILGPLISILAIDEESCDASRSIVGSVISTRINFDGGLRISSAPVAIDQLPNESGVLMHGDGSIPPLATILFSGTRRSFVKKGRITSRSTLRPGGPPR